MNAWLKPYTLASVIVALNASMGSSADSVVYRFDDWTVTVTPRDSQLNPPAKTVSQAGATMEITPRQRQWNVAPVALRQETAAPPKPMLEADAKPQADSSAAAGQLPQLQAGAAAPEIAPQQKGCCDEPVITPRPSDPAPPQTVTTVPLAQLYRDVYKTIPFSRVEFNHNPTYRHDATMEFLFNQMRTTIINRNTTSAGYDYYAPLSGGYLGYPYYDPPAYPFSYGLRIHRSR